MIAASLCRPPQPSSEGTNATDQTSITPAARTLGLASGIFRQLFFFESWRRPAGCRLLSYTTSHRFRDQPSCYACGQNFRQSDTPFVCQTLDWASTGGLGHRSSATVQRSYSTVQQAAYTSQTYL